MTELCDECRNKNKQYPFEHRLWLSKTCDYCILGSDFESYYEKDDSEKE